MSVIDPIGRAAAASQRAKIHHRAALPQECVSEIVGKGRDTHDLINLVDAGCNSEGATTETAQEDPRTFMPEKGSKIEISRGC